jgi:nondiscriminating aspartyl-tRNA synthetase
MERKLISELEKNIGETVKIAGWIHTIRNQKKMQFLIVRDHTGLAQVVHERQKGDESIKNAFETLTVESVVEIAGKVIRNKQVKLGQLEIVVDSINVLSVAATPIPTLDETTALDTRLDWRFLDLRRPINRLIFQIQTTMERSMREYWEKNDFIEIHSPKLMGCPSESGAELFYLEYFGQQAYLAQSPQFYKQMAMTAGLNKVFEIGPVFRANPSFTPRHDTEFTSVDIEIAWIESHEDIMRFEENWLQYVLQRIKEKHEKDIEKYFNVEVKIPTVPFPRVTMEQAYEILKEIGYEVPRKDKGDLDPEGERLLYKHIKDKFGHEFVFITEYPITVRPFYHMRYNEKPEITKSFDLIWKGLEITTGAQREHRYDILVQQTLEKGLSLAPLQYYLDFFKYGCPPHGGLGVGLTRLLMNLLELKSVREVTYLYRGPTRLSP